MPDTDSERTTEKDLEALDAIVDIVRREGEDAVTTLCQIHAELEDAGYDLDPVEEAASHPNLESLFNTIMPCIVPADTDPPDDAAIMMQAQAAATLLLHAADALRTATAGVVRCFERDDVAALREERVSGHGVRVFLTYSELARMREALAKAEAVPPAPSTNRFVNHYRCPRCKTTWEDVWDCACNDRCPKCNAEIEPEKSVEIPVVG